MESTKDIRNYLQFYIGQECLVQFPEDRDGIKCILDSVSDECATFTNYAPDYYFDEPECGVKPLLRKLESLTEAEDEEFKNVNMDWIDGHWYPPGFVWLLSKGFDIFGLIDDKLAIDKLSTIKEG